MGLILKGSIYYDSNSTQWKPISANDNLGNHTATQVLQLNNQWLDMHTNTSSYRIGNTNTTDFTISNEASGVALNLKADKKADFFGAVEIGTTTNTQPLTVNGLTTSENLKLTKILSDDNDHSMETLGIKTTGDVVKIPRSYASREIQSIRSIPNIGVTNIAISGRPGCKLIITGNIGATPYHSFTDEYLITSNSSRSEAVLALTTSVSTEVTPSDMNDYVISQGQTLTPTHGAYSITSFSWNNIEITPVGSTQLSYVIIRPEW